MTKAAKLLARMRQNPQDWRIEDLKTIAERHGLEWRQPGTSHVVFITPGGEVVSVPAHRPVKAVYVRRFLDLIDLVEEDQ